MARSWALHILWWREIYPLVSACIGFFPFKFSLHIIYIDIGVYGTGDIRQNTVDRAEKKKRKGNEAETQRCNDKKSQTNIAMRMVHILSGPGNIRRTLFIRLFFARLESSKELTIFLEIDTMLLGCSKCCHSQRLTVIFYFSLFLAVLNLECFGIILTDK